MLIYVVLTTLPAHMQSAGTNWGAVAIIILYEIVFAFGWLGTCWIYGPEIAPLKYRHVAGSLGAAGEWFSTFVMVFGGGTGINAVGPKIFIWPLLCCFLAAAYVYFLCPESKSLSFDDPPLKDDTDCCYQLPARLLKRLTPCSLVPPRFARGWSATSPLAELASCPETKSRCLATRAICQRWRSRTSRRSDCRYKICLRRMNTPRVWH